MNAKIKQRIENITRENFAAYPDHWLGNRYMVGDFAKVLWENRNELEKEEENEAGVKFEDYLRIIRDEFLVWFEDEYLAYHEVERGNYITLHRVVPITEDLDAQQAVETYLSVRDNNPEYEFRANCFPRWLDKTVTVYYDVHINGRLS